MPAPGAAIPLHGNIGVPGQGGNRGGADDVGAEPQVGPNNARGDGAAAAGNNPAVDTENQVVQANYIPVPPPLPNAVPAQPAAAAQQVAAAQQAAQPVATRTSIVRELVDLTNLRNLYLNSGMEAFLPEVMQSITILQNQLNALNQQAK